MARLGQVLPLKERLPDVRGEQIHEQHQLVKIGLLNTAIHRRSKGARIVPFAQSPAALLDLQRDPVGRLRELVPKADAAGLARDQLTSSSGATGWAWAKQLPLADESCERGSLHGSLGQAVRASGQLWWSCHSTEL